MSAVMEQANERGCSAMKPCLVVAERRQPTLPVAMETPLPSRAGPQKRFELQISGRELIMEPGTPRWG